MAGTPRISSAQEIRVMVEHHGLAALDSYEYAVMSMRVGVGFEGKLHSLAQIAAALGIDRNQVFQIEKRAMAKLRHPQWTGVQEDA